MFLKYIMLKNIQNLFQAFISAQQLPVLRVRERRFAGFRQRRRLPGRFGTQTLGPLAYGQPLGRKKAAAHHNKQQNKKTFFSRHHIHSLHTKVIFILKKSRLALQAATALDTLRLIQLKKA